MSRPRNEAEFITLYITFHTRHLQEFNTFFDKLSTCFEKVKNGDALEEREKLSFKEYAILRSIAALKVYIEHLDSHQLADLHDKVGACHDIVSFVEQKKGGPHFKIGMFIEADKKEAVFNEVALHDFYISLRQLVSFSLDGPLPDATIKPHKS